MSKREQRTMLDNSTLLPLGVAVTLMDRETQQRLVLWLRDRAADRLGLSDPFVGIDFGATAGDDK